MMACLCLARVVNAAPPPCATLISQIAAGKGAVKVVAFSPEGDRVAYGTGDDGVHLWRVGTDTAVTAPSGGRWLSFVQRKPRAPWRLLALGARGTVQIYDPTTLKRDDWIDGCGTHAVLATRPAILVTTENELSETIRLFPLGAENPSERVTVLPRLVGFVGVLSSLAASADGSILAFAGTIPAGGADIPSDGFLVFWNRQGGARPQVHKLDSTILALATSPEGALAASVGYEGSADMQTGRIHLWDMASGRLALTLAPQPRGVASAAFRPGAAGGGSGLARGETLLATGGLDGSLRFWDVPSGRLRGTMKVDKAITALAFDGPGDRLAVGTDDGVVRVYSVAIPRDAGSDVSPRR